MQHSPQEIKTKLGEAVDPEGNVLNMAAVVEVIGLLERTPLTKEALEQTRIGRTVNLLRKKTDNDDIARRAKRLVKKWQKLVQNHLEAVRNTNSPLNGLLCNTPVVNGSVKNEEQISSAAGDVSAKLDHKSKGTKRKRLSVDSSSSVETQGNGDLGNKDSTSLETMKDDNTSKHIGLGSNQSSFDSEENLALEQSTAECSQNQATNLLKRIKTEDDESYCHQQAVQVESDKSTSAESLSSPTQVAPHTQTNNSDHTDVRWERKDVGQQTDDILKQDSEKCGQIPSDLMLNVTYEGNGINGRFGEDGNWYSWSETMSCNEGNLIILPYVLLE